MTLLSVDHLRLSYAIPRGTARVINGLSFELDRGEALGLVGESGSGKSQTALAILGLAGADARIEGSIRFEGAELLELPSAQRRALRGAAIGMVFQDPMTSLNPYLRIDTQLLEGLRLHRGLNRAAARAEGLRLLDAVRMPEAARRLRQHPHELSGGQRQRVCIAMALACGPRLLIADEPTTALDVTLQAQVLELLGALRREFGLALLLITHDLAAVAEVCERTLVMYAGQCMEYGATQQLLERPAHPYTRGLLDSRPSLQQPLAALRAIPGNPPGSLQLPAGCPFQPRCAHAFERCTQERPAPRSEAHGRVRACHASPPVD